MVDAALALATAIAFVTVWTNPGIPGSARRVVSFGLTLVFVVLWHEVLRSWQCLRTVRGGKR
jgi:hypothetical protein